jgi:hypothetical protein
MQRLLGMVPHLHNGPGAKATLFGPGGYSTDHADFSQVQEYLRQKAYAGGDAGKVVSVHWYCVQQKKGRIARDQLSVEPISLHCSTCMEC